MTVKTQNRLGSIAICKADYPHTIAPPQVHPEVYANTRDMKAASFEESGLSRMAAQSTKPAGLDSGASIREYRDATTQRFATQEEAFERFVLDTHWLMIYWCKQLGAKAPDIYRQSRYGSKPIKWSDVDMGDVRIQIVAASTLPRTPAGRTQTVLEWAQAGVISQEEARRLMGHPDLERALSLYTSALESIEEDLEAIEDGKAVAPEPFDNLRMAVWRATAEYHLIRKAGAPERVLEALRQYITQAAYLESTRAANANAAPQGAPAEPAPQAALAPQAMQLRAM
jgi:hypothetical protein